MVSIICDVAKFRLLYQIGRNCYHKITDSSFILIFPIKESILSVLATSSIINWAGDFPCFPGYFENQIVSIGSYNHTNIIVPNMFNYKKALQDFNVEQYSFFLIEKMWLFPVSFNFNYMYSHVINGGVNDNLRENVSCGPIFTVVELIIKLIILISPNYIFNS